MLNANQGGTISLPSVGSPDSPTTERKTAVFGLQTSRDESNGSAVHKRPVVVVTSIEFPILVSRIRSRSRNCFLGSKILPIRSSKRYTYRLAVLIDTRRNPSSCTYPSSR